jgi:hypothetical protein
MINKRDIAVRVTKRIGFIAMVNVGNFTGEEVKDLDSMG